MSDRPAVLPPRETLPTRAQALAFQAKAALFRLRRSWQDAARGRPVRLKRGLTASQRPVMATVRGPLYASGNAAEFALQAGKVQNLRVAAHALHGLEIPSKAVFSFWANVGRTTARRGFVKGRELREGCVIPSIGGGLCQLSNALYDCALQAGLEIVERHAHSRRLPGSSAEVGRDATVFWNYVDLRLRAPFPWQIRITLSRDELIVQLLGRPETSTRSGLKRAVMPGEEVADAESCETCGMISCFRHPSAVGLPQSAITAWVVDAFQPEHAAWMEKERQPADHLLVPLDSTRWRCGPYRWPSRGFARVHEAPWAVLQRSWVSRRLATQGAERQRALLRMDERFAAEFARRLPATAVHLVVSQNLLPFLWQSGALGGRTFDVLMTRLPIEELQRVLDTAAAAHPASPTLADFRAPAAVAAAESEALAAARRWITPHSGIAALAGDRAVTLPWKMPPAPPPHSSASSGTSSRRKLVFPASTLGRKGAWELRAAWQSLDEADRQSWSLQLGGPVLEGADFWQGVDTAPAAANWLEGAAAVVLPAWVEHQPRRLLQAVAAGVPVIASAACGLANVPGATTIPTGDVDALRAALAEFTSGKVPHTR
jgi:hypothetical protein